MLPQTQTKDAVKGVALLEMHAKTSIKRSHQTSHKLFFTSHNFWIPLRNTFRCHNKSSCHLQETHVEKELENCEDWNVKVYIQGHASTSHITASCPLFSRHNH